MDSFFFGDKSIHSPYGLYLSSRPAGLALEIGAGDGAALKQVRDGGWKVEAQEVDPKAAAGMRARLGLRVHTGALETLSLPSHHFDAVLSSHVLEHVHEPVGLLKESYRILRPGGRLIFVTPNAQSTLHRHFESNWFFLDPPRHLHIFTPQVLGSLAGMAGFTKIETVTTDVHARLVVKASLLIQSTGRYVLGSQPTAWLELRARYLASRLAKVASSSPGRGGPAGEECILIADK
jgi:SAM-dependent methyltransferase